MLWLIWVSCDIPVSLFASLLWKPSYTIQVWTVSSTKKSLFFRDLVDTDPFPLHSFTVLNTNVKVQQLRFRHKRWGKLAEIKHPSAYGVCDYLMNNLFHHSSMDYHPNLILVEKCLLKHMQVLPWSLLKMEFLTLFQWDRRITEKLALTLSKHQWLPTSASLVQ